MTATNSTPAPKPRLRRSGFTLVELLVTLSIIALISSFALPAIQAARQKTMRLQAIKQAQKIYAGVQRLLADTDCSPKSKIPMDIEWWIKALEKYEVPRRTWYVPGMSANPEKDLPDWMCGGANPYDMLYAEDKDSIYLFMTKEALFAGHHLCILADGNIRLQKFGSDD